MSGVRTGSRLERLEALRDKVEQEIAHERREIALGHVRHPPITSGVGIPTLARMGKTHRDVKEWGIRVGLITSIRRGRAPDDLVRRYLEAHA